MIEVENLTKYYGEIRGIEGVSFLIEKGEIVGFLGPNGSGKTTTMRILTCFFPPTSGRAKVAGYDVTAHSREVRRRIGYMPETVPLYPDMKVKTYLTFVAEAKRMDVQLRKKKMGMIMEQCGIEHVSHRLVGNLSKGFRQRVGLAQALINDPEVLILDEPTIGLDPKQVVEIRDLIKDLAGERTIILSSHVLPEVSMTCERVIIIHEGRVVAVDTPDNLMARLQKTVKTELGTG
jgi:ABC-2 type transport system ATP-binding protein